MPNVHTATSVRIGAELLDLRFPHSGNPFMIKDAYIVKGKDNLYYVTLPPSLDTNGVTIEIISSKLSTVKINAISAITSAGTVDDQEVSISVANVNIDHNLNVEITSESGISNNYTILAQRGIQELDSLIYAFKERYDIPGVSFAIGNTSKTAIVYESGYGFAIKEDKVRVTPDHLFRLASMSKQHTAICILKLIEEGKFGIDDFVFGPGGILKDKFPVVSAKAERVTVRHLLEHTSGFRRYPDYMFDTPYYGWSMKQRIDAMLRNPQPNEPGTVFGYYNTGYGLLGYIVEEVSGMPFDKYLELLYHSGGIDDIHIGGTQAERRPNEVAYYGQNSANAEGMDMQVRAPAGGVIASTEQLFKLLWAIDGKPNIPDILNAHSRELMFTPSKVGKSRYALGWRTNHNFFPDSFYHGGTLAGVATFWIYADGYAVVFLCNSRSNIRRFDDEFYSMARDIIAKAKEMNL